MKISVKGRINDVLKALKEIERTVVPMAAQQGMNRAANTVKSRTTKELAAEMALRKVSDIRPLITIRKANKNNLEVTVTVEDKALGIEYSKKAVVKQTTKGRGSRKRKSFTVTFKGEAIPQAFRTTNIGGLSGKGIFTPLPKAPRYKTGNRSISRVFAYTTVQELIHAKLDEMQERIGSERFEVEFERALNNALTKLRMKG